MYAFGLMHNGHGAETNERLLLVDCVFSRLSLEKQAASAKVHEGLSTYQNISIPHY